MLFLSFRVLSLELEFVDSVESFRLSDKACCTPHRTNDSGFSVTLFRGKETTYIMWLESLLRILIKFCTNLASFRGDPFLLLSVAFLFTMTVAATFGLPGGVAFAASTSPMLEGA